MDGGWSKDTTCLKTSLIPRVSILKTLSAKQWGSDKLTLRKIYLALIRSRIDYGSIFYYTASYSLLKNLDTIQNTCLRLILGAQRTSPISSPEVECNISPLSIRREELIMRNLCRLPELPKTNKVLFDYHANFNPTIRWSLTSTKSYFVRASALFFPKSSW